jgi:hypothetical protein
MKIMKDECAPRMLINCPSFRAAPHIWESLDTRRVMFASVIMADCIVSASDVVERRKIGGCIVEKRYCKACDYQ